MCMVICMCDFIDFYAGPRNTDWLLWHQPMGILNQIKSNRTYGWFHTLVTCHLIFSVNDVKMLALLLLRTLQTCPVDAGDVLAPVSVHFKNHVCIFKRALGSLPGADTLGKNQTVIASGLLLIVGNPQTEEQRFGSTVLVFHIEFCRFKLRPNSNFTHIFWVQSSRIQKNSAPRHTWGISDCHFTSAAQQEASARVDWGIIASTRMTLQ